MPTRFFDAFNHSGKLTDAGEVVLRPTCPWTQRITRRALLRWSAAELAREAALGLATIKRAELADGETSMTMANDLAVRRALEAAGVEFIDEDGGGPGVRLRQQRRSKAPKK